MPKPLTLLPFLALIGGCFADEGLTGYAPGRWHLVQNGGADPSAATQAITLDLSTRGLISGRGPCNAYSAPQTAPYPWFAPGPVTSTHRACPGLAAEQAYLAALSQMSLAEVSGPVLILSNDAGETLEFRPAPPA